MTPAFAVHAHNEINVAVARSFGKTVAQGNPPRRAWPIYLRPLKLFSRPADRGLGDIIHRLLGPMGRVYPALHLKIFGRDCGCRSRRARWNTRYPLPHALPTRIVRPLSRSQVLDNAIQVRDRKSSISF